MIIEAILFVITLLLLHYWATRPRGMPPGPYVIPFIGCKPVMSTEEVKSMHKKYGDIFKTELGQQKFIYLCNNKLIKEAFAKIEVSNRPSIKLIHFMTDGKEAGVLMSNGKQWHNSRRFLLRNLRDLGMGKTYLEESILEEARELVKDFKTYSGKPTHFPESVNVAVLNIIWQMVASQRYDLQDKAVLKPINITRSIDTSSPARLLEFVPWLKPLVPEFLRNIITKQLHKLKYSVIDLLQDTIETHKANLDPSNPRDVIDEYLIAMNGKSEIAEYFNDMDLMRSIFDLFLAGFETTSSTLRWMILYMAKYPEVQRRVQQCIDEAVPRETLPSYQHRSQLTYVDAMIHEVFRVSSMLHDGVQRAAQSDTYVGGYFIPKGSWVFGCSGICHKDSRHWDEPEEFRPERFLDAEGKLKIPKDGLLPFGAGRRICLGESLARMELYIFSAALLQNFTFAPPEGGEIDIEASPMRHHQRMPKDQDVVITIRK